MTACAGVTESVMSFYNVNDSFARDREQLRSGLALNGCYVLLCPGDIGARGGAEGACVEGSLRSIPPAIR